MPDSNITQPNNTPTSTTGESTTMTTITLLPPAACLTQNQPQELHDNPPLQPEAQTQQHDQNTELKEMISTPTPTPNNPTGQMANSTNTNQQTTTTRFKWTKEKSQVAMNLVKHGCKPKLVSVAVGCSLRTAQKFVETVVPKQGDPGIFREHEIRRRGRKSKDVNQRLEAIREALAKDSTKTQVEIAADLKVSNTTVCRDIKKLGGSWKEKKDAGSQAEGTKRKSRRDRQSNNKSTINLRV